MISKSMGNDKLFEENNLIFKYAIIKMLIAECGS